MNIIQAIHDPHLFRPFLGDDLTTWEPWLHALKVLYGLPLPRTALPLLKGCTGRDRVQRKGGYSTALFLTGRRSGKSRTAAIIGAYEAALAGHEKKLAKGERGVVLICSPTRSQSRIVHGYLRAVFDVPLLRQEIVRDTKGSSNMHGFELRNGNRIEILAGDFRYVRGFTVVAAIVDEICFFGTDADTKLRSDTALIQALEPALLTTQGKLIAISSPYAERGWSYKKFRQCHGNDQATTLVWKCASRTMNSTLPQHVIDQALLDDPQAAASEYLGEFRSDICTFVARDTIEACIAEGRQILRPQSGVTYAAFVDLSGGRGDDAALAIAHREGATIVIDVVERYRPPFSPDTVVAKMVQTLGEYHIDKVVGDNYSAEWTKSAFETRGIRYTRCTTNPWSQDLRSQVAKPKSQLYLELLPRLQSQEVELLDHPVLIEQLAQLERRTRVGGRDTVDHPQHGHDDLANVVAGVCDCCSKPAARAGVVMDRIPGVEMFGMRTWMNRQTWTRGIVPGAEEERTPFTICD